MNPATQVHEPCETGLSADFSVVRPDFQLRARLEVGAEILVLFGPSGSGKTTTLDALAGIVTPDRGRIALDGRVLFNRQGATRQVNLPARLRRVGYVFQQYALFPHLTVLGNVVFPLRGSERRPAALQLLERLGLGRLVDRFPDELSGGQQQRVAIARALAASPRVLLLDEPFSALDQAARQRLQGDLRALQRDLGLAVIYVTHRLEDAFAVGQRLAVMRDGEVAQVGPIEDVFRYPADAHVAGIMGITNLFRARVCCASAGEVTLDWDGLRLEAPPQAVEPGRMVTAYIRPEDVKILYPDRPIMEAVRHNRVEGRITSSRIHPGARHLLVSLPNGHEIEVRHPNYTYAPLNLEAGQQVQLALRKQGMILIA